MPIEFGILYIPSLHGTNWSNNLNLVCNTSKCLLLHKHTKFLVKIITHSPNKKHGTNMILWTTLIFHVENENIWHERSPLILIEITLGLDVSLIHWKKLIHDFLFCLCFCLLFFFCFVFLFCISDEQMISKAYINVGRLFDFS